MVYKLRQSDITLINRLTEAQKANADPDPKLEKIIEKARSGEYNDFFTTKRTPKLTLYTDLRVAGYVELAKSVLRGDYNGTEEEKDEWLKSPEGRAALKEVANGS